MPIIPGVCADCGDVGPPGPPGPPGSLTELAAGETIQQFRVVALDSAGLAYLPDPLTIAQTEALVGIALTAALTAETFRVQTDGVLITAPMWTPGPLYLTAGGILSSSLPVTGNCLQVAVATSSTTIVIRPQAPVVLI